MCQQEQAGPVFESSAHSLGSNDAQVEEEACVNLSDEDGLEADDVMLRSESDVEIPSNSQKDAEANTEKDAEANTEKDAEANTDPEVKLHPSSDREPGAGTIADVQSETKVESEATGTTIEPDIQAEKIESESHAGDCLEDTDDSDFAKIMSEFYTVPLHRTTDDPNLEKFLTNMVTKISVQPTDDRIVRQKNSTDNFFAKAEAEMSQSFIDEGEENAGFPFPPLSPEDIDDVDTAADKSEDSHKSSD